jgi:hypothetical protein
MIGSSALLARRGVLTGGASSTGGAPLFVGGDAAGGGARCRLLGSVAADSIRSATQRPAQRLSAMVSTWSAHGAAVAAGSPRDENGQTSTPTYPRPP